MGLIGCGGRCFRKSKFNLKSYMSTNYAFIFLKKLMQKYLWKIKKPAVENFISRAKKKVFYKLTAKIITANKGPIGNGCSFKIFAIEKNL